METGKRLAGIDALRGVAALMVLAVHYEMLPRFVPPYTFPPVKEMYAEYGLMGVELFFVISGFVILMTIERSGSVLKFAVNRAGRLYPAYWVTLIVAGFYYRAMGETSLTLIGTNATMAQTFAGVPDVVIVYWSLAYELWFYAVIAVIAAAGLLQRIDYIALAWFALAIPLWAAGIQPGGLVKVLTMWQFGQLFIAGMMIYLIATGRTSTPAILALALAVAYSLIGRPEWHIPGLTYCAINAAFIAAVYLAATGRLRAPRWLVWTGTISYSLYLLHAPIGMMLVRGAKALGLSPWLAIALAVVVALTAAWLSYRYVEQPGQPAMRNLFLLRLPAALQRFRLRTS